MPKYYAIVDKKTGDVIELFIRKKYAFEYLYYWYGKKSTYEVRECQIKIGKKVK